MRSVIRSLLPLLAAAVPFVVAAACSSGSSSEETARAGAGGVGGSGSGGSGQAGSSAGGQAGTEAAGAGGSEAAGSGGSETAGSGGSGEAGSGQAGSEAAGSGQAGSGTAGTEQGGAGGSETAGSGGSEAGGSGGSGQAGSGTAGSGTAGSGQAGSGGGWPTCDEQPAGSTKTSLPEVWTDNPADYKPVWLEGLTITAVSFGACSSTTNFQCLLFLQTQPSFNSLSEGKHQGIKLFVSAKASPYFSTLGVGDVVNLYGNAIRYTSFGTNELRIHVDIEHPGCAKKVGSAVPTPIGGVALSDLTIDNYENAIGPLLVQVDTVKGRPTQNTSETFALYESELDGGTFDAGLELTQVLTPYYLPGGNFQGLTADTWTNFTSIAGVYSVFTVNDAGQFLKYRMLGPRTQGEIMVQK